MKASRKYRSHSIDFKLRVLQEYYESGMSKHGLGRKYDLAPACIRTWLRQFESGLLSLPPDLNELERQVYMARKKNMSRTEVSSADPVERLNDEIARLRKALAYSELRNEALHEVLRIGREKYGIDLLKKAGAKQ